MSRAYTALFRIRFTNLLQYRAAAIAGMSTQFAWGFMFILAFRAFYASNPYAFPMTFQQTVAYIWIQQAFIAVFFIYFFDESIFESIESGYISYELVRPMDLYSRWFTMTAARRMATAALRCIPILAVAFFLPEPFRLVLPGEPFQILLFFISLFLSMSVVVSFTMLIYVSSFFTINSTGVRSIMAIGSDFFAGGYLPIPFFPDWLRIAVELSPFGAMQNMPLLVFSGHFYGDALVRGMLLQMFWLVVLVIIGRVLMRHALKRVIAQGG